MMEKMTFHYELSDAQKKLKEDTYHALLQNKHVLSFMKEKNVDEAYIYDHCGKISDWSIQISKCDGCVGLDFCRQPMKGHFEKLTIDGFLISEISKCVFLRKHEEEVFHRKNYKIMNMNEELLKVDLEKLTTDGESKEYRSAYLKVIKLINGDEQKGLYLCGVPGVGKTYLAAGITNYYAKQNKKVAFINVPKFISDLKMLFSDHQAMEQRLREVQNVEVLVLDDIGGESITAWSRDEILLPLLDKRMERKKLTIFTSNYKFIDLYQRLSLTSNKMSEPIAAERLMDRIKALSCEIFIKGESRRK